MTRRENELDDSRAFYLQIWESLFLEFLGWDKTKVMEWARGWSCINDPMFYHETALYYAVPQLVPEAIRKSLSRTERERLYRMIEEVVDQPALYSSGAEPYDWAAAKDRVRKLIDEFGRPSD